MLVHHLLWLALSALGSAALTALACRWWFGRLLNALQKRLEQSEQARRVEHERVEHERGQQTRVQIAQLSKAITELQRRHRLTQEAQQRRAQLDERVPSTPSTPTLTNGFADTLPM